MADALSPRSWPSTGTTKLCTSQLLDSSQFTSNSRRIGGAVSSSHDARWLRGAVAAAVGGTSSATRRDQTRLVSGSKASTAKAAPKPAVSITTPAITGPTTLLSAGARPSQLNTRFSPVGSLTSRPAVRWIAIRPKFAPPPHSIAAAHSTG